MLQFRCCASVSKLSFIN